MKYIKGKYYYIKYATGGEFICAPNQNSDSSIRGPRISTRNSCMQVQMICETFIISREATEEEIQFFNTYSMGRETSFLEYLKSRNPEYQIY